MPARLFTQARLRLGGESLESLAQFQTLTSR
jgi:hypothetical protein